MPGILDVITPYRHATRALYTDDGEVIFEAQRPLLLNGIEEIATRGDLADRAIVVMLPTIPERQRLPEEEFWAKFEQARPRLLGIVLDAVVSALARLPEVELSRLPRMADFAKWATAAEQGFGWPDGTFLTAYAGNRAQTHELTLEASPIAASVRELAARGGFFGTASQLLTRLREQTGNQDSDRKDFPPDGPRLSGQLRRIAPVLRASGIEVEFNQPLPGAKSKRGIRIGVEDTVTTVDSAGQPQDRGDTRRGGDGRDGRDGKSGHRSNLFSAEADDQEMPTRAERPAREQAILDELRETLDAVERRPYE